jgi:hypothetical protein
MPARLRQLLQMIALPVKESQRVSTNQPTVDECSDRKDKVSVSEGDVVGSRIPDLWVVIDNEGIAVECDGGWKSA